VARQAVLPTPVDGFATNLTLDIGQYAAVGTRVIVLIDGDSYRVTGFFEETKIPAVKVNKPRRPSLRRAGCGEQSIHSRCATVRPRSPRARSSRAG
jgi:multidrug resistance efflux pump